MLTIFGLILLGFIVGTAGTLIGVGGGFILMPALLYLYPKEPPELLTSISLAVIFCNALSGTLAYGRMKRIDYRSALLFSAASIPGAIMGAWSTGFMPRKIFEMIFGGVLTAGAIFLWLNWDKKARVSTFSPARFARRKFKDAAGNSYEYAFNPIIGVIISIFVGFISSLLGIGGGIIHVPALAQLLGFPIHIATATSHFILAATALTGTTVHIVNGVFSRGVQPTLLLCLGALLGAQLGARLSTRVDGKWIIRGLALALATVGIRLVITTIWG